MLKNEEKILIITAPSGAGKTSITRNLLSKFPELEFSVSATTRKPRSNEHHGKDYYFISLQDFEEKIKTDKFAEWEMVYEGKYYGTLREELQRIWLSGKVPVLDIDVHGAIHVQQHYSGKTLSIFIEPPSVEELKKRLEKRGTESLESIEARWNKASYELTFKSHFDTIIVNDDLEIACKESAEIVHSFLQINKLE